MQHYMNGMTNPTDPDDIGAAHDIWVSGNSAYLATVNGGVWRSTTFHTYNSLGGPHWQPMTDQMPCLSMSSISGSADDANVVIAGCGFQSNSAFRGGEPMGAMLSTDAGTTWAMTSFPPGYWISSVLAAGPPSTAVLLVSAKSASTPVSVTGSSSTNPYNVPSTASGGIWRSTDAGASFSSVFSTPVNRMVRHPTTSTTIYATTLDKTAPLIVSTDGGATWTTPAAQPNIASVCAGVLVRNPQVTINSVGGVTTIVAGFYVADDTSDTNPCYALFYSRDSGASWTPINNLPAPTNGLGLGSQGVTNFAILLAPTDSNTLFVSGTGRVVLRTDITTSVWTLISQPVIDPPTDQPAYRGTATPDSAPHADARNFFWDATSGELLLTDDGGIYKRTSPLAVSTAGGWSSLAGDLAITEAYQVAVDPVSGAMILGAQDNSIMLSQWDGSEAPSGIWSFLLVADGTTVGLDSSTTPASFYGANQALGGWLKTAVGAGTGNTLTNGYTPFTGTFYTGCTAGDNCFSFITPQAVNLITPSKIMVCTSSSGGSPNSKCFSTTFPSTVQAMELDTSTLSISGSTATGYVYGGRKDGVDNANVVFAVGSHWAWARSVVGGSIVSYTGSCTGCTNMLNTNAPWRTPVTNALIAQHPRDYFINLVIDDSGHCWLTTDFGQTFKDLNLPANSNLLALSGHTSVDTFNTGAAIFIDSAVGGVFPLVIGTTYGSFVTFNAPTSSSFVFYKLGANQAKTIPSSYSYQASSDTLTMSLFGRGIWQLQSVSYVLTQAASGESTSVLNPLCTTPLYPNVATCFGYSASGTPPPIGAPTGVFVPATYPVVQFDLDSGVLTEAANVTALAALVVANLADVCGLEVGRIILLSFVQQPAGNVSVSFSLSNAWGSSLVSARTAANSFLTLASNVSSRAYALPTLRHAWPTSVGLGPSQRVASDLDQVTFKLKYSSTALPANFATDIMNDIATVAGVAVMRVVSLGLVASDTLAGGVETVAATFLISPSFVAGDKSASDAVLAFIAAAKLQTSPLFSGTVTAASILGSARVSWTNSAAVPEPPGGTPPPADASTSGGFFSSDNTLVLAIIGGAIVLVLLILLYCGCRRKKDAPKAVTPTTGSGGQQARRGFDAAAVQNPQQQRNVQMMVYPSNQGAQPQPQHQQQYYPSQPQQHPHAAQQQPHNSYPQQPQQQQQYYPSQQPMYAQHPESGPSRGRQLPPITPAAGLPPSPSPPVDPRDQEIVRAPPPARESFRIVSGTPGTRKPRGQQ